jgi:hypothetical protein
LKGFFTL